MTGERRPWWYSGDEEPAAVPPGPEPQPQPQPVEPEPQADASGSDSASGMDWSALLVGAQRMVDWATTTVMAPHAEHGDPADHPDCVVCRTVLLVGERSAAPVAAERTPVRPIEWIPIRD